MDSLQKTSYPYRMVAGVDIGNSTTEVVIASIMENDIKYLSTAILPTTGVKGTIQNVDGVLETLKVAADQASIEISDLSAIMLNEATPVISEIAMETISQTEIIGSSMIGHNPDTPGGRGIATGITRHIENIRIEGDVIAVVPAEYDFEEVAEKINAAFDEGYSITGVILKKDDGVLVANRLKKTIPIVDEVLNIEKVPLGMKAAIEVAGNGETIKVLSNPYGLATLFSLSPSETKDIIPISKSLIGNRSGVVIKNPEGNVKSEKIPAGSITMADKDRKVRVDVLEGAEKIMQARSALDELEDAFGDQGTNVGAMLGRVKEQMSELTGLSDIKIKDVLAVDTFVPVKVSGAIAGEYAMENAVLLAAMVKTSRLPMEKIAQALSEKTGVYVKIEGQEANMAILGALTTPGSDKPLAILDMGGGSTDAAIIDKHGNIKSVHLSGAGEMVTMIINSELALEDKELAELIKKYPLAKVDSLLNLRFEDGSVKFMEEPLDPDFYARVVVVTPEKLIPIRGGKKLTLEKIRLVRREAKKKVFVTNAMRALTRVAPDGNIRNIEFVVMVGGSALDFEIPEMISNELANYRIVAGRGNIRGSEGPRNAVATGLVIHAREG
ncbi:MAG: diol dehydratase reactivase subunit alpha [Clostridia bacterium]|nr:diol dehydratase reactivase subunit alpha [Clostridia bacterium]